MFTVILLEELFGKFIICLSLLFQAAAMKTHHSSECSCQVVSIYKSLDKTEAEKPPSCEESLLLMDSSPFNFSALPVRKRENRKLTNFFLHQQVK